MKYREAGRNARTQTAVAAGRSFGIVSQLFASMGTMLAWINSYSVISAAKQLRMNRREQASIAHLSDGRERPESPTLPAEQLLLA